MRVKTTVKTPNGRIIARQSYCRTQVEISLPAHRALRLRAIRFCRRQVFRFMRQLASWETGVWS